MVRIGNDTERRGGDLRGSMSSKFTNSDEERHGCGGASRALREDPKDACHQKVP